MAAPEFGKLEKLTMEWVACTDNWQNYQLAQRWFSENP
jgi:hypothetical protein